MGICQARILEWVAISFFRGSSQPRDPTGVSCVSCVSRRILYHCAIWGEKGHENGELAYCRQRGFRLWGRERSQEELKTGSWESGWPQWLRWLHRVEFQQGKSCTDMFLWALRTVPAHSKYSQFVTHSNQQNHCHSDWQVPWGLLGSPVCIALLKAVIKDFTVNSIM